MTDPQQTGGGSPQGGASKKELADELRELGNHIKDFLHIFWESRERKQVQQEIETGVSNLGESINRAASEFQQSRTGQRIKEEFDSMGQRIQNGELESTIRQDFLNALRTANAELEKALQKMSSEEKTDAGTQSESKK
jgi:hypothetical protein